MMAKRGRPRKGKAKPAPRGVSQILAPTDFSPGAEAALQWATRLSELFGAQVTILHVIDPSLGAVAGFPAHVAAMPAYGELLEVVRREAKAEMSKIAATFASAKPTIREGTPRGVILDVAEEIGADLIVMGTHGRTGLAHVFFGSVAEHVVRLSRVPVLTVRQRGD